MLYKASIYIHTFLCISKKNSLEYFVPVLCKIMSGIFYFIFFPPNVIIVCNEMKDYKILHNLMK